MSTTPPPFVPNWSQGGATWNQRASIYGYDILAGNTPQCIICGNAVYCGGPKCPNGAILPNGPDGVPQVQAPFQSVTVQNYQQGQASTDPQPGYNTISLITQVA